MQEKYLITEQEGGGLFLSPCILYYEGSPLFFYGYYTGKDMMTKRVWQFLNTKEKGRKTIGDQTKILERYKNANYRIEGRRSITPGNWKRKRTMLLHHREVREFKEFYEYKGTYLEAMKAKGKELKKGKGMWIESVPESP